MKKEYIIAGVIIAALIFGALLFLPDKEGNDSSNNLPEEKTNILTSKDGSFMVSVPDSALPEGVSIDDLTVSKIEDKDRQELGLAAGEFLAGYDLGPEGLEFSEPLDYTVVFRFENIKDMKIPYPYHVSLTGKEVDLPDASIEVDETEMTVTLRSQIKHFSSEIFYTMGNMSLDTPSGDIAVGASFGVTGKVQLFEYSEEWRKIYGEDDVKRVFFDPEWGLEGKMFAQGGVVAPAIKEGLPPKTGNITNLEFSSETNFSCAEEGTDVITYEADIKRTLNTQYRSVIDDVMHTWLSNEKMRKVITYNIKSRGRGVKCVKADEFEKFIPPPLHIPVAR